MNHFNDLKYRELIDTFLRLFQFRQCFLNLGKSYLRIYAMKHTLLDQINKKHLELHRHDVHRCQYKEPGRLLKESLEKE